MDQLQTHQAMYACQRQLAREGSHKSKTSNLWQARERVLRELHYAYVGEQERCNPGDSWQVFPPRFKAAKMQKSSLAVDGKALEAVHIASPSCHVFSTRCTDVETQKQGHAVGRGSLEAVHIAGPSSHGTKLLLAEGRHAADVLRSEFF